MKYWILLFLLWLTWLICLFLHKVNSSYLLEADYLEEVSDTVVIEGLVYSGLNHGALVNIGNILGFKVSKAQISSVQKMYTTIGDYKSLSDLYKYLLSFEPPSIQIKQKKEQLAKGLYDQIKNTNAKLFGKETNYTIKSIVSDKQQKLRKAEVNLKNIQEKYARHEATILELQKAADEFKKAQSMPAMIEVSKKQSNINKTFQKPESIKTPNESNQSLIFEFSTLLQTWMINNEVKSQVAGKFLKDSINVNYKIIKKIGSPHLSFKTNLTNSDSLKILIYCNETSTPIEGFAIYQPNSQKYQLKSLDKMPRGCIKNKKARIKLILSEQVYLYNLLKNIQSYK